MDTFVRERGDVTLIKLIRVILNSVQILNYGVRKYLSYIYF